MNQIIPTDAPAVAPVQSTRPAIENLSEKPRSAFYLGMQDAVEARDLAALRAAAPMLTLAEAKSLLFHASQLDLARLAGRDTRARRYARETWGAQVPRVVMSATVKVRVHGLLLWYPELGQDEAQAIVETEIAEEMDETYRGHSAFWRYAPTTPCFGDQGRTDKLLRARAQARLDALLSYCDAPLRQAHEAALQVLETSGIPFELLVEWHKAGRTSQAVSAAGEAA